MTTVKDFLGFVVNPPPGDPSRTAANDQISGSIVSLGLLACPAVPDFNMDGSTITISGGSLSQGTLSAVPTDLIAGRTMIVDGLSAPVVVQTINTDAKIVTFTTPASGAVSGAMCAWGTDNTGAINMWLATLISSGQAGLLPAGKYLVTGTVGWPDDSKGHFGVTVYCGGAAMNTARLRSFQAGSTQQAAGGTTLVWGGVAGGTLMAFQRVGAVRFVGGIALVGQPSYDPSGTFTPFGNRAGICYDVRQDGNPATGTGYHHFDTLLVGEADLGVRFASGQNDNNCDTSRFDRLINWRCTQTALMSGGQQTTYSIGFLAHTNAQRGIVLAGGGTLDVQELHVVGSVGAAQRTDAGATAGAGVSVINDTAIRASDAARPVSGTNIPANAFVGTVTPGVSFTIVQFPGGTAPALTTGAVSGVTLAQGYSAIEARSSVNGANTHIGLTRIEQSSSGCFYVGAGAQLHIDSFEECLTAAANLNLFYVDGGNGYGGMLRIGQISLYSHNAIANAQNSPFYIGAGSSKTGKLQIDDAMFSGAGSQIGNLNQWFYADNNAWVDIEVRSLRDGLGNTYNPIRTRLQRGACLLYGTTTDAATSTVLTQAGMPSSAVFGFGPQIPKGYSILQVAIVGDRGDGTFTSFLRQLVCTRTTGAATVAIQTPAGWTDDLNGTDQISVLQVTANQTLQINVQGTASQTINWQATVTMLAFTAAVAP